MVFWNSDCYGGVLRTIVLSVKVLIEYGPVGLCSEISLLHPVVWFDSLFDNGTNFLLTRI